MAKDIEHIHQIESENIKFKTKLATIDKENIKLKNYVVTGEPLGNSILSKTTFITGDRQASLIINLKMELKQAKAKIDNLSQQNQGLRRSVKYTNISQIEIQKKALLDETARLKAIVGEFVHGQNEQLAYKKEAESLGSQLSKKIEENAKLSEMVLQEQQKVRHLEAQLKQKIIFHEEWQKKVMKDMRIAKTKIQDNIRREQVYKKHIENLKEESQRMVLSHMIRTKPKQQTLDKMTKTLDFVISTSIVQPSIVENQPTPHLQHKQPEKKRGGEIMEIIDLMRYRLQAQRYSLEELGEDVLNCCPDVIKNQHSLQLLQKHPFFLSAHQATLIVCEINPNIDKQITKEQFNAQINKLIDHVHLFTNRDEDRIAEGILNKMKTEWNQLQQILKQVGQTVNMDFLCETLSKLGFTLQQIQLIINDLSLSSNNLNQLEYTHLNDIYIEQLNTSVKVIKEEMGEEESQVSKDMSLISRGTYEQQVFDQYANDYV